MIGKTPRRFEELELRLNMAPVVDVGDHYLLPNTHDQTVQIWVSGADQVEGANVNVQVSDGGPALGGIINGPSITNLDLVTGTIFANNNTGQVDPDNVGSVTHTFTIVNSGNAALHLTGNPLVQITGDAASDFVVTRQPDATILPGGQTTFDVTFTPSEIGLRQAEVVIYNDDSNENPYNFAIQGTGSDDAPQWEGRYVVTDSGTVIADGLLATVTIDTTGFTQGTWDLILGPNNLNGSSDFSGIEAQITDGRIILNNKPIGQNDSYSVDENSSLLVNSVLNNDSDLDGDPLTAVLLSGPSHGQLTMNQDGSFEYRPDRSYFGSDSFEYIVTDGHFNSNPVTVDITINQVNEAPVAVDDVYGLSEDSILNIGASAGVLANDYDMDADPLAAQLISGPAHGQLAFKADGSFVYTPNANYNGSDSFTYKINDGYVDSNVATVSLNVSQVTDILAENLVYNNSYWDGFNNGVTSAELTAIAGDKTPLRTGQKATYANVSNYEKGINEVVFFVDNLVNPGEIEASDFNFLVGNTSDVSKWIAAPAPTSVSVQENVGAHGEDVVHLIWADGAIKGTWLQIEMKANDHTGLAAKDVSYFGSAIGDTGNSTTDFIVNNADVTAIQNHPRTFINPASPDTVWDINRDSRVNGTDMNIAKKHLTNATTALQVITPIVPVAARTQTLEVPLELPAPVTSLQVIQTSPTMYVVELEVESASTLIANSQQNYTTYAAAAEMPLQTPVAEYKPLFSWSKGASGQAVNRVTLDINATSVDEVIQSIENWVDYVPQAETVA